LFLNDLAISAAWISGVERYVNVLAFVVDRRIDVLTPSV
jgi:hypothetical protein